MRRFLSALLLAVLGVLLLAGVVFASWAYKFPSTVISSSVSNRTYYPVLLGYTGQTFIDAGKINANGLNTNMQVGATSIPYMITTTKVATVVPNLPIGGQVTADLYTGYAPAQTGFSVIAGHGGYVTTADAVALEPGADFDLEVSGYVNTGVVGDIVHKTNAVALQSDGAGNVRAVIGQDPRSLAQVIYAGSDDTLAAGATEYNSLMGAGIFGDWNVTESAVWQVMPTAGTLGDLRIRTSAAVGAGATYIFTIMKNGAPTTLVATVAAGATTASDVTHVVTFAAGDTVSIRSTSTGAPGAPYAQWSTIWNSTAPNESIFLLNATGVIANTVFDVPQGTTGIGRVAEADVSVPMPTAGTFSKLYVKLDADPGAAPDAYSYTLRKAAADTTLTTTITADATTGNDIVDTVAVVAGDLIDIKITPLNVPAVAPVSAIGMVFTPTVTGQSVLMGGGKVPDAAATEYTYVSGGGYGGTVAGEATVYDLGQTSTLSKLYVHLSVAPDNGAGVDEYTFTLRDLGGDTALTTTIADAATTGSDLVNTYDVTNGMVLDMKTTPANAPAGTIAKWALVSMYPMVTRTVAVASGAHTFNATLTGGTFSLTVAGGGVDSAAYAGSVPDNGRDWILLSDVAPYFTDFELSAPVAVLLVHYQPNTMLIGNIVPDREGAAQDGTITWGANTDLSIVYGAMVSYESTDAETSTATGFTMSTSIMPQTWFAQGENLTALPFYDSFSSVSTQTGIPVQSFYFWGVIGLAFGAALFLMVFTRSALLGVMAMNIILFIGSSQTIIPMWIPFSILIVDIAIMYLYRQVSYG